MVLGIATGSRDQQDKHLLFTDSKAVLSRKPHRVSEAGELFKIEPAIFISNLTFPHILLRFWGAGMKGAGAIRLSAILSPPNIFYKGWKSGS